MSRCQGTPQVLERKNKPRVIWPCIVRRSHQVEESVLEVSKLCYFITFPKARVYFYLYVRENPLAQQFYILY